MLELSALLTLINMCITVISWSISDVGQFGISYYPFEYSICAKLRFPFCELVMKASHALQSNSIGAIELGISLIPVPFTYIRRSNMEYVIILNMEFFTDWNLAIGGMEFLIRKLVGSPLWVGYSFILRVFSIVLFLFFWANFPILCTVLLSQLKLKLTSFCISSEIKFMILISNGIYQDAWFAFRNKFAYTVHLFLSFLESRLSLIRFSTFVTCRCHRF